MSGPTGLGSRACPLARSRAKANPLTPNPPSPQTRTQRRQYAALASAPLGVRREQPLPLSAHGWTGSHAQV
jgi:hypothetical protein